MRFNKALQPIAALSFDLDDTLYDNAPVIAAAESWFAAYLTSRYRLPGYCLDVRFWTEQKKLTAQLYPQLKDDVTLLRAQALCDTFERLKRPLKDISEALQLVDIFIDKRSAVSVPPETHRVLQRLALKLPLCAISNGNVRATRLGLKDYFAFDLRPATTPGMARKPAADLYLQAAARLNIPPQSLLHVGDEPMTDVAGALAAGCQCAWLRGGIAGRSPKDDKLFTLPTLEIDALADLLRLI